jgi:hypothetical protein
MKRDKNFKVKRGGLLFAVLLFSFVSILTIFLSNNQISAVGETSFCCERTTSGAWCQNSPPAQCAGAPYRTAATSCASTSYCKLGTCVNSQEGTCLENTPQKVCQDSNGVWVEGKPEDIPQCQLGCCIVGDQSAFVTQTRCKSLAGLYGVNTSFRTDIKTEADCIATANPQVRGACVLDHGFNNRDCKMLTRAECQQIETTSGNSSVEFHEGFLCSAESLATNCGPTQKTTCVENKDEVYFLDSCGNLANIYDASKINDKGYWTTIQDKAASCNPNSNNAGSVSCGNCDYLSGSTCKAYQRNNSQTVKPNYGNFACADLSCNYKGKNYKQGETWCGNSSGVKNNLPGSEYSRLVCYNGEVTVEQCASFRQQVCIQDNINGFSVASCKANRWQDCVAQDNKNDCENTDKRDCQWMVGQSVLSDSEGKPLVVNSEGKLVQGNSGQGASCVPKYAPGFDFWNSNSSTGGQAQELCMLASQNCVVKVKKPLGGVWQCESNCDCIGLKEGDAVGGTSKVTGWINKRNNLCLAIGDCGNNKNYIGVQGYQANNAVVITKNAGS